MLDTSKTPRLYEAFPPPLPPTASPYGFLLKPLRAFLLSAIDLGNPAAFVPAATVKAAFELFLSAYLSEEYRPSDIIRVTNETRRRERRMPLECSFRGRDGSFKVLDLPNMAFLPLLAAAIASKEFRAAFEAQVLERFEAGEITASQRVLMPEFLPFVGRVSSKRVPVLFNAGILPVGRPLPDDLLREVDPRFEADPPLSRATFPRFKLVDLAHACLPEGEIAELTKTFESVQRSGLNGANRIVRRFRLKLANLYASGATRADDPKFLDADALAKSRAAAGGLAGIDAAPTE